MGLQGASIKKVVTLPQQRIAVKQLVSAESISERQACRLLKVNRGSYRHVAKIQPDEEELRKKIRELSERHPRYGCRFIHRLLNREGFHVNRKRVHRIWKAEGLQIPRKRPKRRRYPSKNTVKQKASHPNHVWTYDFLEDRTENGSKLRIMTVLDEFTRESLSIRVDKSITHEKVIESLSFLFLTRGTPEYIRSDNGPEFVAKGLQNWLKYMNCKTIYITPGSPWENGYIESFHDKFRSECLNRDVFRNGHEAQIMIELWRQEYNEFRPHSSLNYLSPLEFAKNYRLKMKQNKTPGDNSTPCYVNSVTATPPLPSHSKKNVCSLL